MEKPTKRILSGVQPSGDLHLGNYLGAIKNFVSLQHEYECFFCVVDLHAITVWQDPAMLAQKTREVTAAFIASGAKGLDAPSSDFTSLRPNVYRDRPHLERVLKLIELGAVTPPAIKLFSLDEVVEAQALSQSRHFRGKLVFNMR